MDKKDTLLQYGKGFQLKTLNALVTDVNLVSSLYSHINPEFFDSNASKWIVETVLSHFDEYKGLPTIDVFKVHLSKLDDKGLKKVIVDELKDVYSTVGTTDLEYIKKEFTNFCRNQNLKQAIIHSVDLLKVGNYERIQSLIDSAMKIGLDDSLGHDYAINFDSRMEEESRGTVHTGWNVVDDIMQGGLGPGELGVVVAPSGVGKTWILCKIAAAAVKNGLNVVHYTLELSEFYVGQRYDTIFSGIPSIELRDRKDEVLSSIQKLKGKLLIKYFPPKSINSRNVALHLDKLIASGNKPDLIIIDYADLMGTNSGRVENTYSEQGGVYIDLRGMGGEYAIPIWTASQATRGSINEEVIEADKIADSYAKVMNADFIMSISRKASDKLNNTARLHIMKNRFGQDGITFPCKMDTYKGFIEVYDAKSSDGIIAQKEAGDGKIMEKQMLFKKYAETMGTDNSKVKDLG
jgi:replicative DNA helicase